MNCECDICTWKKPKETIIALILINIYLILIFKSCYSLVTIGSYMYLFYLLIGTAICQKGKENANS